MCGIYGYIGTPKDPKKVYRVIKSLAIATESRGVHSTGVAAINSDTLYHERRTVCARDFFNAIDVRKIVEDNCHFFIGHNRWASIGDISIKNAHPFIGDKYIFAHNGTVPVAKLVTGALALPTDGETDSESMLVLIEKYGKGILKKFHDLSIVLIDYSGTNDSLVLYRDNMKPMWTCDVRDCLGVILYASTREILGEGLKSLTVNNYKTFLNRAKMTPNGKFIKYDKDGNCRTLSLKASIPFMDVLSKVAPKKLKRTIIKKEVHYENDYRGYWARNDFSWEYPQTNSVQYDEERLHRLH